MLYLFFIFYYGLILSKLVDNIYLQAALKKIYMYFLIFYYIFVNTCQYFGFISGV